MNTIIFGFDMDHVNGSIDLLERNKIIDIKLWIIENRIYKKDNDHKNMITYNEIMQEKFFDDIESCPSNFYQKLQKDFYLLMILSARWNKSIEISDHEHDIRTFINYWYNYYLNEKIEFVCFNDIPHGAFSYIAYIVAKKLDIKVLIVKGIIGFDNLFKCFKSIDGYGGIEFDFKKIYPFTKIEEKYKKDLFYMKNIKEFLPLDGTKTFYDYFMDYNFKNNIDIWRKKYDGLLFSKILERVSYLLIKRYLVKAFYRNRDIQCVEFDRNRKYVYFPLHLQPELTTDVLGGVFHDQLLAIEYLSDIIPEDWIIYVKENPKQSYYNRSRKFFERLKRIKKAKLVHRYINTYDLIEHSQFVSTISGTVGWEAISGGKNVLIFGTAWYEMLPGVFKYHDSTDINDILNYKIEHSFLERKFNELKRKTFLSGVVSQAAMQEYAVNFDPNKNIVLVYNSLKEVIENY